MPSETSPRILARLIFVPSASVVPTGARATLSLELGWAYTKRWQEPDFEDAWLPAADHAMDMAGLYSGAKDSRLHRDVGNYLLIRSKTLDPSSAFWNEALQKTGKHYRLALDLEKAGQRQKLLEDMRTTVWNDYPDPEMFERLGLEGQK